MRTIGAVALLTLVWAAPSSAGPMPPECDEVVIPASASPREAAALMQPCVDALRTANREPRRSRTAQRWAAAPPPRAGRQFAAIRELGAFPVRRTFQGTAPGTADGTEAPGERCALGDRAAAWTPSATCAGCHPRHGHPVARSYATSFARAPGSLRTEAEVVRRGVLLRDGRVECVTCHDGGSPWKHKIALPPGSPAVAAVVAGRPGTYQGGRWRLARAGSGPQLPRGAAVSPAPLCAACHTHAD